MRRLIQVFALVLGCAGFAPTASAYDGYAELDLTQPITGTELVGDRYFMLEGQQIARLTFQSLGGGLFSYSLTDLVLPNAANPELGWTELDYKYYGEVDWTYTGGINDTSSNWLFEGWGQAAEGGPSQLSWTGNELLGGTFYAAVTGVAPSVPEPSGWAMLLVGLLFVGHIVRRRMPTAFSF